MANEKLTIQIEIPPYMLDKYSDDVTFIGWAVDDDNPDPDWAIVTVTPDFFRAHFSPDIDERVND